jgi:uncharacterized protein with gpF-like domain
VVRLQADKQLGRSYPVLYALNEGLYKLGYISHEIHEIYEKRYSEKLIHVEPKFPTKQEQVEQRLIEEKTKTFSMVLQQWNEHLDPEWRRKWIEEARNYREKIQNARLILALEEQATTDR